MALALGSGGARGYAHIGAIQVLEERNLDIVTVAGASMGAMVGGMYVAGGLESYTSWVTGLNQMDLVRLIDAKVVAEPGLIGAEKVFARIYMMVGDPDIESLPIPFTAVVTDLHARQAVWLQRGPLLQAIRASIAMPGMFTPVRTNGRLLVDGGLTDPVPVAATASAGADVTIAIDLNGEPKKWSDSDGHETGDMGPFEDLFEWFRRRATNILQREMVRALVDRISSAGDGSPSTSDEPIEAPGRGMLDVMNLSLEAVQAVLTKYRLAEHPPQVLVSVPRDACHSRDFHKASKMIEIGRRLTSDALDRAADKGLLL